MARFLLALTMALVAGPVGLWAQEKIAESPYYPLKVGTAWHYRAGDKKTIVRVVKHEKVGDTLCALLETERDGTVGAREHIGVKEDGIYRFTGDGVRAEPPVCVLKLPPKKG